MIRKRVPARSRSIAVSLITFVAMWSLSETVRGEGPTIAPPKESLARVLEVFDQNGSGDHDGRVEVSDLNPEALAQKLARRAGDRGQDWAELWGSFRALCAALNPDPTCAETPENVTGAQVRGLVSALRRKEPGLVMSERLAGGPGAVRTDSLRGIHDGADPEATHHWTWAYLLLNGLGVPRTERSQTGLDSGFPVDPERAAESFPGYLGLTSEQIGHLLFGVAPRTSGQGAVSIRGRTAATLHEAVSTPRELLREGFRAPGMLFLAQEGAEPSESLVETGVHHLEKRLSGHRASGGAFFLVTFGANDLFSYRQIVVAAPEVTEAAFEQDLKKLETSTAGLSKSGVRRIYVLPPPVDAVFEHHRLPRGSHYTDGTPIPEGSCTLHHWWLAAYEGRRLPRQVVLPPAQLPMLRARQDAFSRSVVRVLGVESNWLVVDTRDSFRALLERIYGTGISVDDVPGYGTVTYAGSPAVVSSDSIHPTPFAYLLWSEMVLEELRDVGVQIEHDRDLVLDRSRTTTEKVDSVLRRASDQVRRAPSFFRPSRFPFDPERPDRVALLRRTLEALDPASDRGWAAAYSATSWIWPYVPDCLVAGLAKDLGVAVGTEGRLHHEVVGEVRRRFEMSDEKWTPSRREAYRELLRGFVESGALATARHARYGRALLAALSRQGDRLDDGFSEGHTPGLFGAKRTFSFAAELSSGFGSRLSAGAAWARAGVEFTPYRTPPAFTPVGFADFLRIESHAGLHGLAPLSVGARDPRAYAEAWLAPLGITSYADSAPNLAVTLQLPVWRPLVGFGGDCRVLSTACVALARFSASLAVSFWPWRDPAFDAGSTPAPEIYAATRGSMAFGGEQLPLGGSLWEAETGAAITW
jgi:hypothetical protein